MRFDFHDQTLVWRPTVAPDQLLVQLRSSIDPNRPSLQFEEGDILELGEDIPTATVVYWNPKNYVGSYVRSGIVTVRWGI